MHGRHVAHFAQAVQQRGVPTVGGGCRVPPRSRRWRCCGCCNLHLPPAAPLLRCCLRLLAAEVGCCQRAQRWAWGWRLRRRPHCWMLQGRLHSAVDRLSRLWQLRVTQTRLHRLWQAGFRSLRCSGKVLEQLQVP